jgi:hypothetical protein
MSNLMKIRPVGDELFHADRRMDITKQIVALRNLANSPKHSVMLSLCLSVRDLASATNVCRTFMKFGTGVLDTKKKVVQIIAVC